MFVPKHLMEFKQFQALNKNERLLYLVMAIRMMPFGNSKKPLPFYAQLDQLSLYCGWSITTTQRTLHTMRGKGLVKSFGANSNLKWCIIEMWEFREERFIEIDIITKEEFPTDYRWLYEKGLRRTPKENKPKNQKGTNDEQRDCSEQTDCE